jgi:competence protein ComEC
MLVGSVYMLCQILGFISEYADSQRLRENKISILTMADVGQGDGFMIRLWSGHVFFVDVGEFPDRFISAIRKPSFNNFGKKESLHVDLVFLSHDDADHAGALNEVWKDFKSGDAIGSIVTSPYQHTNINKSVEQNRIIKTVSGDSFAFPNSASVKVLWPKKSSEYSRRSANDDSVVMHVTIASTSILFTGDASEKVEKELIQDFSNNLKVDILKVGHHGSKSSSMDSFIKITNPYIALISAGKNNRYKHPSTQALKRLKQDGREIMRTDQCGTVRILIYQNGVIGKTPCALSLPKTATSTIESSK